ncbi:unnamed protein product [Xylocopa violacea]|uniref:Cyclin-dependent kinase 2-interacting protein n=1 Tax=Xylocopa violacea TaxID=135666 RepID=A0ABP1NR68_XYLVO
MVYGKKEESHALMMSKEQFSPVNKLSPGKATQGKNLTGSARHMRDLTADIHANIQQWNTLHLQGISLLENITQAKQDESYSQVLQELCDKLETICNTLDNIVQDLGQITHQMKVISSLENKTDKLFTTWPTLKFAQVAELIHNAYSCETKVKRKILEDVAHYYTEPWKMLFLASWVHQPLLPKNLTTFLESMLIETGHR